MANEYEIFEFLEAAKQSSSRKMRRVQLRGECDPFDLDDDLFIRRYRLTKQLVRDLCDELRPAMKSPKKPKPTDLDVDTKVLIALAFYSTGSYQRPVGSQEGHFVAQQTVSSVIAQVTACLNAPEMRRKYITFPQTRQERNVIVTGFYNKFGIPGVLGCIDCTHVAIVRPVLHEERYYSRKHYHSLNVQLICDANMHIMSVDASYGGANHDSFVWANHPVRDHLEELGQTQNIWLLGDSGYPLRRSMLTPILNATPGSPEAHYTDLHVLARNTIERTIGLLKARFRCLLVHRVLHYAPEVAGSIVNACVVLHNICNRANVPVQDLSNESLQIETSALDEQREEGSELHRGLTTRSALVQRLWASRHSRS